MYGRAMALTLDQFTGHLIQGSFFVYMNQLHSTLPAAEKTVSSFDILGNDSLGYGRKIGVFAGILSYYLNSIQVIKGLGYCG